LFDMTPASEPKWWQAARSRRYFSQTSPALRLLVALNGLGRLSSVSLPEPATVACGREAGRFVDYQVVEEFVTSIAAI
jgi:hypothetical protein